MSLSGVMKARKEIDALNLIDGEIGMMHPQLDEIYGEYIQDA